MLSGKLHFFVDPVPVDPQIIRVPAFASDNFLHQDNNSNNYYYYYYYFIIIISVCLASCIYFLFSTLCPSKCKTHFILSIIKVTSFDF